MNKGIRTRSETEESREGLRTFSTAEDLVHGLLPPEEPENLVLQRRRRRPFAVLLVVGIRRRRRRRRIVAVDLLGDLLQQRFLVVVLVLSHADSNQKETFDSSNPQTFRKDESKLDSHFPFLCYFGNQMKIFSFPSPLAFSSRD